jgi:Putative MetA-pathway of phenol degradation
MVMRTTAGVFLGVILSSVPAGAQDTLRDALTFLMTNQGVQTSDFQRDRAAAEAASDAMQRALLVNLASAPIATSSGGFLYRLNPELGTVERASETFGTLFVERALTAGQGNFSFGMAGTTAEYDRLNGFDLKDGSFITVANRFRDEAAPFDTESLTMNVRASTMTFFANFGVTDEFDVGAVVPLARVSLDGERLNVYRGTSAVQAVATGSASGLADIALRAKYAVVRTRSGGVAAAGEVRLPTGDEENLLGAGSTQWRLLAVGSLESGPLSVHGNGGIVRGGLSDETFFAGALSAAVHPRATITGEIVRRHVTELHGFDLSPAPHPTVTGVDTFRLTETAEPTTLWTAITGVKWNVSDTLVIGGHLLWSLRDRGLTSDFTPTVAVEYSIR